MERTISMMIGHGSINHNNRKFIADNVDRKRVKDNVMIVNQDLQDVYHELFDEALKKYNEKQTRKDRKIKDYYEHVRLDKQLKQFHEVIVQIGNQDDMACGTEEGELAKEILLDYMEEFQNRNPYLKVFNAVIHMDEATPHLHINFVPFSQGNERGLETQVSLKGALKAQGITGSGRRDTEWNRWIEKEKEACAVSMARYGVGWNHLGTHKEHLSVLEYKKQERIKEVEQLETQQRCLEENVEQVQVDLFKGRREAQDVRREVANAKDELQEVRADIRKEKQQSLEEKEKLVVEQKELREENHLLKKEKDSLEREKWKLQLEVDKLYVEKREYLEQYEKKIAEFTDKDKKLQEDIADKESTKDMLEQVVQNVAADLSAKEEQVEKVEQKLSSINELLNKYRDPIDQREKMIELQLKIYDLEEEVAILKQKLQQAYDFMKSKFLDGINMFEEFARSIGAKVQERWEERNRGAR